MKDFRPTLNTIEKPMKNGRLVEVKLHGDDNGWYLGKVIRARKMWVELRNYPWSKGFIADECSIQEWRYLRKKT